jgi:hypothetical protein
MPPSTVSERRGTKRSLPPQFHSDRTSNQPAKRSQPSHSNPAAESAQSQIPDEHRDEIESILPDLSLRQITDLLVQATWMHRDINQALLSMRDSNRGRREEPSDLNVEEDDEVEFLSPNVSVNGVDKPRLQSQFHFESLARRYGSESASRSSSQLPLSRPDSRLSSHPDYGLPSRPTSAESSASNPRKDSLPRNSRANGADGQIADQPRQPWHWPTVPPKFTGPYLATAVGKWWYRTTEDLEAMERQDPNRRKNFHHIGRIMETELGQRHDGDDRCPAYIRMGYECWTYTVEGTQQIASPGSACARCWAEHRGNCSHSARRIHRKPSAPRPPPSPPNLLQRDLKQEERYE